MVITPAEYTALSQQKDFLIASLYTVLSQYSEQAQKSAERFKTEFSGKISIQGDNEIPYNILNACHVYLRTGRVPQHEFSCLQEISNGTAKNGHILFAERCWKHGECFSSGIVQCSG